MLGPKQYDVNHRVKPRRDLKNPMVNRIIIPKFKWQEKELRALLGSLMDNFKHPSLKVNEKLPNPLIKDISFQPEVNEKDFEELSGSFLDRLKPDVPKTSNIKPKKKEPETANDMIHLPLSFFELFTAHSRDRKEEKEISEEAVNRITCKVFQNIKQFLRKDTESPSTRNIKIDINF